MSDRSLVEELDDGPPRWEPPAWWVPVGLLVVSLVAAGCLVVPPTVRWLAPVAVTDDQLGRVFEPRLTAGGSAWGWAYRDRPGTLGAGYCDGALAQAYAGLDRIWVADGERGSGVVFSGRFRDGATARAALAGLENRYAACGTDRFAVRPLGGRDGSGVAVRGFAVEQVSTFRAASLRRELRFVAYANTLAVFVGERLPDDEVLATAWRAGVRRAAGR